MLFDEGLGYTFISTAGSSFCSLNNKPCCNTIIYLENLVPDLLRHTKNGPQTQW